MEPHNIPMVVLGAVLLWFGWFGFNGGSAVASGGLAVSAFVVTLILAKIIDATIGLRVTDQEESVGLDISQHADKAYS